MEDSTCILYISTPTLYIVLYRVYPLQFTENQQGIDKKKYLETELTP